MRLIEPQRLRVLTRALAATAGRAALRRGVPLYLALFVASMIVFTGDNPMRPAELTGFARQSPPFRAVLLGVWLVLTLPVARTLLANPTSSFLRAFPLPWPEAALALGLLLLAAQLPWTALWLAGEGPGSAASASLMAAGGHALLVGRPRRWYERLAAAGWMAGLALGPGAPFLLATPALVLGARRAWLDGVEPRVPDGGARSRFARHRAGTARSPARALGRAYAATLWRGGRRFLLRWLWFWVLGAGIAALAIRNNQIVEPGRAAAVALAALAPTCMAGALGVAGAMLRQERQAGWWLDAQGATMSSRALAPALAAAPLGLALGLLHGLLVARLAGAPWSAAVALRLGAGGAAGGLAWVALATRLRRWADRGSGQDGGRLLTGALLVSAALVALVLAFAERGVLASLALVAVIPGAPRAGIVAGSRPPATAAPEDA